MNVQNLYSKISKSFTYVSTLTLLAATLNSCAVKLSYSTDPDNGGLARDPDTGELLPPKVKFYFKEREKKNQNNTLDLTEIYKDSSQVQQNNYSTRKELSDKL